MAVSSFALQYGFYLSASQERYVHLFDIAVVAIFLLETVLSILFASRLRRALLRAMPLIIIAGIFGIQMLLVRFVLAGRPETASKLMSFLKISSLTKIYILILQGYIIFSLVFYTQKVTRRLARTRFRPAQLLVAAFVLMIISGTALLLLPKATPEAAPLSVVDALFTSTSAVCVTGLIVVDTAAAFTRTGQFLIMLLIQIGGLGIMTFAAFFALLLGRGFSIKERLMFGEIMHVDMMRFISRLVISILIVTFCIESIGSILFFFLFPAGNAGFLGRLFTAVFHSVSGFCNAGFSTLSNGFMGFSSYYWLNLSMMAIIILGGLGFTVHHDIFQAVWAKIRRRRKPTKLKLQTRVVLITTFSLVVLGAVLIFLLERGRASFLQSLFQSVTARTAGFNTISQKTLGDESLLLTMFLMFIGAAPGSTAGGIKITTMIVFAATVGAMLRGRSRTELSRKTIPEGTVREALVIFGLSLFAVIISFMLLLIVEDLPFSELLFETVSAFGTVGLSLGATPNLSAAGKVIIIMVMLFGRLGPMTIALAVSGRLYEKGYAYPEEKIMVG